MDYAIQIIDKLNIPQLIATGLIVWYFYQRLDAKIGKLEGRTDKIENSLSNKIDKLSDKIDDIDKRLCRLEGAFSSKECCMIKDDRKLSKAE